MSKLVKVIRFCRIGYVIVLGAYMLIQSFPLYGEELNYLEKYYWLRETFEANDAGFQYVIDRKGQDEYQKHNARIERELHNVNDLTAALEIYKEWLSFFRTGHLSININWDAIESKGENEFLQDYDHWESYEISEEELREQLSKEQEPGFAGIWFSEPYTIGIFRKNDNYIGTILKDDSSNWREHQVKLKITPDNKEDSFSAVWFMKDYSPSYFTDVQLVGNNYLTVGRISLRRIYPEFEEVDDIPIHFELLNAQEALIKRVSDDTLILRIPTFEHSHKPAIDSLLAAFHEQIIRTENLIIDLRNNGGGSDISFINLIPYLYTNPIRTVGVEFLSTTLNNRRMEDWLEDPVFAETAGDWVKESLDKLNASLGEFVVLNDTVRTDELDTVYKYPKNVAIIINENNGSTTEQFLLAARQSKKVKLYGRTTAGNLDISNMYFVDSPCGELRLGYSLSRSLRLPEMPIDEIGIQPDFFIDKFVPEHEWLNHIMSRLNYEPETVVGSRSHFWTILQWLMLIAIVMIVIIKIYRKKMKDE